MTIDIVHTYKEIYTLRKPTNFYKESELKLAVQSPMIIHYTTNMRVVRPWFNNANHPLTDEFRKYLQLSPWKDIELKEIQFTSKDAKIIGIIMKLPETLAYKILGLIHSKVNPFVVRLKSKRGQ